MIVVWNNEIKLSLSKDKINEVNRRKIPEDDLLNQQSYYHRNREQGMQWTMHWALWLYYWAVDQPHGSGILL